ncbi:MULTISPECIES: DHCW motif cupin fold protein [unclassified Pseudoclavibacter]|uniref:DHCW motif cupin fold protein n=1 Tax=unclassified Pseudoclavibacter TaxID=2615177 RepID=UPI001BACAB3D|nr:DHCW motif cupin fold protein [Pseudoclavibacter sp. Marseille-Q4354]MBS3180298.1 DHCW motif cupin fold protein [Pseudoclavibacter sp. Marseille-Q4354]
MDLLGHAFTTTDWASLEPTVHTGTTGDARWRTQQIGETRIRMVDYSPGYLADHWCSRGHVLFVLDGTLVTELDDGRLVTLSAGQSYQVGTDMEAHRSRTEAGARLFIVD